MTVCQMQVSASDRLNLIPCNRPDTALVRTTCLRMAHVEETWLCRRCQTAVLYCTPCFETDRLLARTTRLFLTPEEK